MAATSAKISNFEGLATLTFDLLIFKGVTVHWAALLLNFILLRPSVIELEVERQTDGQRDNGHHCIMPPPYGDGT